MNTSSQQADSDVFGHIFGAHLMTGQGQIFDCSDDYGRFRTRMTDVAGQFVN